MKKYFLIIVPILVFTALAVIPLSCNPSEKTLVVEREVEVSTDDLAKLVNKDVKIGSVQGRVVDFSITTDTDGTAFIFIYLKDVKPLEGN